MIEDYEHRMLQEQNSEWRKNPNSLLNVARNIEFFTTLLPTVVDLPYQSPNHPLEPEQVDPLSENLAENENSSEDEPMDEPTDQIPNDVPNPTDLATDDDQESAVSMTPMEAPKTESTEESTKATENADAATSGQETNTTSTDTQATEDAATATPDEELECSILQKPDSEEPVNPKILGVTMVKGNIMLLVKFYNYPRSKLIRSKEIAEKWPQQVIAYYEKHLKFFDSDNVYDSGSTTEVASDSSDNENIEA